MTATLPILCGLLLTVGQTEKPTPGAVNAADTAATTATADTTTGDEAASDASGQNPAPEGDVAPDQAKGDKEAAEADYLQELRQEVEAHKARYRQEQERRRSEHREAHGAEAPDGAPINDRLDLGRRRRSQAQPKLTGQYRLAATVARHEVLAENIDWFGGELRAEVAASVERNFGDLLPMLPGIGARAGIAYTHRGREFLRLDVAEIEAGVTYQYPHAGLWDLFFPYARLDFVGGWAAVAASPGLKADLFVPGFGTTIGMRVALPRLGNNARFFGVAEIAYQYRAPVTPRLRAPSDEEDPLPGPPVPLGRVDLSAFVARVGVGLEL